MRTHRSRLESLGVLVVRLVPGLLVAGHGAQKLFGSFDGSGMEKWTAATESMGLRPPKFWAVLGAGSEFGGGLLARNVDMVPAGVCSTAVIVQ